MFQWGGAIGGASGTERGREAGPSGLGSQHSGVECHMADDCQWVSMNLILNPEEMGLNNHKNKTFSNST